jgi:hypothetical protein
MGDDWAGYTAAASDGRPIETNMGKWEPAFRGLTQPVPFGDTRTYELGARFLSDCTEIEDWGCGSGWLRRYLAPGQHYRGIDGTATPFTDEIVDLTTYRSDTEAIFMRHVLEHNYAWRDILAGAIASFRRKLVLVLFTPLEPQLRELAFWDEYGVPDLALPEFEVTAAFAGCSFRRQDLHTATQYGAETVFYVQSGLAENHDDAPK